MDRRYRAKVSGKGQVQVPSEVRQALGVRTGDELVFRVAGDGAVYVTGQPRVTLADLAGCLGGYVGHADLEAEERAGAEAAAERDKRVLRELGHEARKP